MRLLTTLSHVIVVASLQRGANVNRPSGLDQQPLLFCVSHYDIVYLDLLVRVHPSSLSRHRRVADEWADQHSVCVCVCLILH
jgi:hypothetical protein